MSQSRYRQMLLQMLTSIILLAYPIMVYFGLKLGGIKLVAPLLIVILTIRLYVTRTSIKHFLWLMRLGVVFGISLAMLSWYFRTNEWLLYYPLIVNVLFLIVFSYTLFNPPPIIERLARLTEPNLPLQAIAYTRKVTIIWCVFFIMNGAITLGTIIKGNLVWWTLYNGAISYFLIGILIGGEWLVRQWLKRQIKL